MLNSNTHDSYRADIDGLRAVAIMLVVLFHAFPKQLGGGFIGVDVFFVISGFLITSILLDNLNQHQFSLIDFYCRRIRRIFPALIIVLIASFAFGWFNLLADEYKQLGKHILGGASFVSNFILWSESGYFDASSISKPLLHLWSLAIEEQFYLVWPILIYLSWRLRFNLTLLTFVMLSGSFLLNIYSLHFSGNSSSLFYLPQNRFWELMMGGFLACVSSRPHNMKLFIGKIESIFKKQDNFINRAQDAQSLVGIILIALGVIFVSGYSMFPGYWALLPTIGTFLIILAGPKAWFNRHFLAHPIIVWIGLISFPLYLWHWPIFAFLHIVNYDEVTIAIKFTAIAVSFILASGTYYFIEPFFRKGKISQFKIAFLVSILLVIGFIGYNTYERDGLTFRLNQIQFRLPLTLQKLGGKYVKPAELNQANSKNQDKKPKIFLWGDSYAEHLLPGYRQVFGENYNVLNISSRGCPPIVNMDIPWRKECAQVNAEQIERIQREQPNRVILAANWTDYDWEKIQGTIDALKKIGYQKIEIVGPAPQWRESLYKQLYLNFLVAKDENIPFRMSFGLNQNFLKIEPQLRGLAKLNGLTYQSITNILCNDLGCITRFGETPESLASFDGGHFTSMTSVYVVTRFYKSK